MAYKADTLLYPLICPECDFVIDVDIPKGYRATLVIDEKEGDTYHQSEDLPKHRVTVKSSYKSNSN